MGIGIKPAGIDLQERDETLLRDLFESRIMTLEHVAKLHFEDRSEAAKKRVQKLKAAKLIAERPRRVYEPSVLHLTARGIGLLGDLGVTTNYPRLSRASLEKRSQVKDLTLRHELEVMDVKTALVSAVRATDHFNIAEFTTWPLLIEFKAEQSGREVTVKPDGFIRIQEKGSGEELFEHTFFLEVDRSTETLETLANKACCYREHYRRGGFALRNGRPRTEFESFPFRVLVVCRSEERRDNAARRLLLCHPPILTQVWLTTLSGVCDDPLGAIWARPADYRIAIMDRSVEIRANQSAPNDMARPQAVIGTSVSIEKRSLLSD
jgi:hypothetical protein